MTVPYETPCFHSFQHLQRESFLSGNHISAVFARFSELFPSLGSLVAYPVGSIIPRFQNPVGQIIVGALFGAGLTIFVTKITAKQSILEQYKKEANLDRKRDVYRPLYAELRELSENLDAAYYGSKPYPVWIKIEGDDFQPSLYQTGYNNPPTFSFWPSFKKNNVADDDFTQDVQYLLDMIQSSIEDYNKKYNFARQNTQRELKALLSIAISQVELTPQYQEWMQKHDQQPYIKNEWFEFIHRMVSPSLDAATTDLSNSWTAQTSGWLFASRAEQAAKVIYEGEIKNMGANNLIAESWFIDIFEATLKDYNVKHAYRSTKDVQDRLYKMLLEAEITLKKGMIDIRDRHQGGPPPV